MLDPERLRIVVDAVAAANARSRTADSGAGDPEPLRGVRGPDGAEP
jgi:hypothetical protein